MLLEYAELFGDLDEGVDATVELVAGVGGTDLYADTGLVFRHNRVVEPGDIDALLL